MHSPSHCLQPVRNSRILGSSYTWVYLNRFKKGAARLPGKSRLLLIPLIIFELLVNCIMLVVFFLTVFAYLVFNMLFRLPGKNRRNVLPAPGN